ncbi:MAG: S9 family peptidase [Bacteroidetes bacterium]|nr:S9 family peptidase [Bacteroidota bacterium]
MRLHKIIPAALLLSSAAFSQAPPAPKANYALAAKFSPKRLEKMLFSTAVDPHWIGETGRFWYMYETSAGRKWWLVDAAKGSRQPLFDNDSLAAALTRIVKDPFDAEHLGIENLRFHDDRLQFSVKSSLEVEKKDSTRKGAPPTKEKKTFYFSYDPARRELTERKDTAQAKPKPNWASVSPDRRWVVFAREYNLWLMDSANFRKAREKEDDSTIVEIQLTRDGIEYYSYGDGYSQTNVEKERDRKKRKPAMAYWSPDSRRIAMVRSDMRKVKDLWLVHNIADPRPTLETYKYHMPGEKEAPVRELLLIDIIEKTVRRVPVERFKDQEVFLWSAPPKESQRDEEHRPFVWLGNADKFYCYITSRDLHRIDLCYVDVASAKARTLIEERMNTYIEVRRPGLINNGSELVHWSERDGWGHFYLYDSSGREKGRITSGPWHAEDIEGIDEKTRTLFFTGNGRENGEDPYYLHLYRVGLEGGGLRLLNAGDADHAVSLDDGNRFFINTSSRVDKAPASSLHDQNGRLVMELERTDMARLQEAGYRFPQPFKAKADDGVTDLYGVVYKPFDFDSTRKYPVIAYVYPGPQTEAVNKAFARGMDRIDRLAQLGFVVVTMGNRGGHPSRSKWYHNYGYGDLRDYGLADKKAVLEQLSDRHSWIDIHRVGIHGHSGGGFMSTAALLAYPDFFKAAVSSSGNHENNIYNRWWSEKHHGVREQVGDKGDTTFLYNIERNSELAANLKGHLLLVTGDVDNNVHPANTIRVVNALIKANKRFDFTLLPGQRHAYGDMTEYFFWLMADHYAKWLLGDFSQPVDMLEVNRDIERTGGSRTRN